ncbi:MAG: amino acid ABC transporter ATP-binding protein [Planctomycetes bacterium]|nr:amino acid ABC transporter ATP-binding protein [Planctomycetota bacterium]
MTTPALETHRLCKAWPRTGAVLTDCSMRVERRTVHALIGASGSGKSTLLRCLGLLEPLDAGSIMVDGVLAVDGQVLTVSQHIRRSVGMVFQEPSLFGHLTALANVTLAPQRVLGLEPDAARERARSALDRVHALHLADRHPDELSGGERQRVAIARSLAMEPTVLLCDEPTSALDPLLTREVTAVLRELALDAGTTMVVATHDMEFVAATADSVDFLHAGRISVSGTADVLSTPGLDDELDRFLKRS